MEAVEEWCQSLVHGQVEAVEEWCQGLVHGQVEAVEEWCQGLVHGQVEAMDQVVTELGAPPSPGSGRSGVRAW